MCVPILLCVSIFLISVTRLWDMIIRLCMCKSYMGHTKVLHSKPWWLKIDLRDIILPLTDKWERAIYIGTKFTNKIWVSDGIRVIEGAVNAQGKSVRMTTIMLHSCIHQTTSLCTQTWCTLSTFWKSLMVGHGYQGEGTGWGQIRKLGYINE